MRLALIGIFTLLICTINANANNIDSAYTKLDFENGCVWNKPSNETVRENEASMGGSAICNGYTNKGYSWSVYFTEGDIRQFVSFGSVSDSNPFSNTLVGGFAEWNSVNTTIEWRLDNGQPFATILRWFIDNINPDTGSADKEYRGNVLVITTVGQINNTQNCVIGYVDARANKNANMIARKIADKYGENFVCGVDDARFFGKRGKYSGTPNELAVDQHQK